jgi:TetR/AcrR family transcriptional regulator, acrAB operon repressor
MVRKTKDEAAVTRALLLKSALSVFSRNGYSATTLQDIAAEAAVTRGAIYWHFGSKAELYHALLAETSSRSAGIIQSAAGEGGSLADILGRVFVRLLAAIEEQADLKAVMELSLFKTERTPELAETRQEQLTASRTLVEGIAGIMRQGIASGELRPDLDPLEMARAFLAFQNGAVYLWLFDPGSFSLKNSAPALAEIFLRGILTSPGNSG